METKNMYKKMGKIGTALTGLALLVGGAGCTTNKDNFESRLYNLAKQEYRTQYGRNASDAEIRKEMKNIDSYTSYKNIDLNNLNQDQRDYLGKFKNFPLDLQKYFENRKELDAKDKEVKRLFDAYSKAGLIDQKKVTKKEILFLENAARVSLSLNSVSN